jgi:serine phosphatase RsbU (regulator of sigma subunit)
MLEEVRSMAAKGKLWYLKALARLDHLRVVPFKRLWLQLVAVFFLFSVIGFVVDLIFAKGQMPYAVVLAIAATCGLNTVLWIFVLARLRKAALVALIVLQFFVGTIDTGIANWMIRAFNLQPVPSNKGINFAAIGIMTVLILSYAFFSAYMRTYGLESFRMRNELAHAQEVQQVILPEPRLTLPSLVVESEYRPAREVGGDFFQILPNKTDGSLLIVAGDVAGKGLKAGMLVALLVGAIRTAAQYDPDPTAVLSTLNRLLMGRSDAQATCLAIRIAEDGAATLANAGHIAPYLNGEPLPMEGALPLGMIEASQSSLMYFELKDGDRLMLMSDGVVEATDDDGHLFGFERVHQLLQTAKSATEVASTAQTFGQEDDISVISVTRTGGLKPVTA